MCVSEQEEKTNLKIIVKDYLSRKYMYEELQNSLPGKSGQKWNFDAVVTSNQSGINKFGVFIKDWDRSIGVNQVRLLEKACIDMGFQGGLIIGNNFSSHARVYGKNKGVQIVTRSELVYKATYQ
jgi:hypothetical protein